MKSIGETKQEIRNIMRKKRAEIDFLQKKTWDEQIVSSLLAHPVYRRAGAIMLYMAMPEEVNLDELVKTAYASGKQIALPKVDRTRKRIQAFRYMVENPLSIGVFGIREPVDGAQNLSPEALDLIVMPGLAFGENGERIGYGGGYYDRFLNDVNHGPHLLAVAYDWQVFPDLPTTSEDRKIDGIVTPTRVFVC